MSVGSILELVWLEAEQLPFKLGNSLLNATNPDATILT